ncbi:MAG: type I pullulanase [Oscillospiraceae bacterium]|nr:type I pullulanase [Oscillospiraceae bacterium]
MKRTISLCLAALLLVVCAPVVSRAADAEIIIHYQRGDGDYEKWNIWSWAAGKDGAAYPFNGEDDFGKVASFTVSGVDTSVGFIVRTDSWEKDVSEDRFIDLTLGSEIWVFTGESEFLYDPPEGYGVTMEFDALEINVHRHRYDGAYELDEPYFLLDGAAVSVQDTGASEFGVTYRSYLNGVNSRQKLTFTAGSDEFEIQTGKALPAGEGEYILNIYIVQGRSRPGYAEDELSLEKRITEARLGSPEEIFIRLSYPLTLAGAEGFGAVLDAGGNIAGAGAPAAELVDPVYGEIEPGYATAFVMSPGGGAFSLSEMYTAAFEGYGELGVALSSALFSSEGFEGMYTFDGELGALYTQSETTFRLWAPTAVNARVNLYPDGDKSDASEIIDMERKGSGVWEAVKPGDLDGVYYTYTVNVNGAENEAVDPYARAAGVNGKRGMVVNLPSADPPGWENDKAPPFEHPTDAVIYELHVRDLSMSESSGIANKGKYLAFTEEGTKSPEGLATGIDHMVELGVTHVHLLPVFDYRSIDERFLERNDFNWGYDPENYNLPEGSYSTDPYNGHVRITEFKRMVQSLHKNGLRVVMDVVYNHTGATADSNLNKLTPEYYYRMNDAGGFANGSGCGNETASERAMVRKLIVDSVIYWAKEYHIDGFRFDLMALHDIETMNAVRAALDEIDPTILVYGEGWHAGGTPLAEELQANKANTSMLNERIAAFSDDIRDGIKGHVFNETEPGFVGGNLGRREDVMFGIAASCLHPQVDYSKVSYSDAPWAAAPSQTITYASAHDNLTLWDKFKASRPDLGEAEYLRMNKLSALLVFSSQGIPFFQAGEEFARTKYGDHNSYKSPDAINRLEWGRKSEYNDLFEYYKGLIALRKAYPHFRLRTADEIADAITFLPTEPRLLAYTLETAGGGQTLLVAVNTDSTDHIVTLPAEGWDILVNGEGAGTEAAGRVENDELILPPLTGFVLAQRDGDGTAAAPETGTGDEKYGPGPVALILTGVILAALAAAIGVFLRRKRTGGASS